MKIKLAIILSLLIVFTGTGCKKYRIIHKEKKMQREVVKKQKEKEAEHLKKYQEAVKRHASIQDKKTRKMMKKEYKKSRRLKENRKEFFLKRWFSKRRHQKATKPGT